MILHIISKSPLQHSALNDAMPYIGENDKIIFIDDGVYACIANTNTCKKLSALNCQYFALDEDVHTRGIDIAENIEKITIQDFVEWVFTAEKNISWY